LRVASWVSVFLQVLKTLLLGSRKGKRMHKARLIILLGFAVVAPFLAGRIAGFGWGALVAGTLILVAIIGILRLGGRVVSALRRGGEQRPEV
jgi:hypothetical protein